MNSFKKIIALSLSVVILSSFTACQIFSSEEKTTDMSLEDLLTATGENGVTVTDFDGNVLNDDEAKEEIENFNEKEEVISQEGNATTKAVNTTKNNNVQGNNKLTTNKNSNSGEGATLPQAPNFNTLQQEFFAKGIYTIEGTMSAVVEGQSMSLPIKIGNDGLHNYVYAQYTAQGITGGLIVNAEKTYLLVPAAKAYVEMGESILSDVDYSGLTETKTFVSMKKVKIGDDIYICEEVKGSDGFSTFFYFLDGTLARIKFEDAEGTSLLKVKSIKPTVDKSDFSVPAGYKKMDFSDVTKKNK